LLTICSTNCRSEAVKPFQNVRFAPVLAPFPLELDEAELEHAALSSVTAARTAAALYARMVTFFSSETARILWLAPKPSERGREGLSVSANRWNAGSIHPDCQ
jgi:hypothetical protein